MAACFRRPFVQCSVFTNSPVTYVCAHVCAEVPLLHPSRVCVCACVCVCVCACVRVRVCVFARALAQVASRHRAPCSCRRHSILPSEGKEEEEEEKEVVVGLVGEGGRRRSISIVVRMCRRRV